MTEPRRNTRDYHRKKCCLEDAALIRATTSARLIALFAQEQYQRTILASQISCLPIWYLYPCAAIRAWHPYLCANRRFHGVAPYRACPAWYLHVLPNAANQPWSLHLKSHALCARQQISPCLSFRKSQLFQGLQIFAACQTRVSHKFLLAPNSITAALD